MKMLLVVAVFLIHVHSALAAPRVYNCAALQGDSSGASRVCAVFSFKTPLYTADDNKAVRGTEFPNCPGASLYLFKDVGRETTVQLSFQPSPDVRPSRSVLVVGQGDLPRKFNLETQVGGAESTVSIQVRCTSSSTGPAGRDEVGGRG